MAGELVPLVLIPRYTSYLGSFAFTTMCWVQRNPFRFDMT